MSFSSILGTSPVKVVGASGFRNVGSFESPATLLSAWPNPPAGLFAGVWFDGVGGNQSIYTSDAGIWSEVFPSGDYVSWDDFLKPNLKDVGKTFAYNPDGSLLSVTDSFGSKTFSYNPNGSLASITGTGTYQSKSFSYNPDGTLASTSVIP